jgi:hypothetical protein
MTDEREPRVRLEPFVTEHWIKTVIMSGCSPNEFASWVLRDIDLNAALARFGGDDPATHVVNVEGMDSNVVAGATSVERTQRPTATASVGSASSWTRDGFFEFLSVVISIQELEYSMTLLGAYLHLGPIPTSDELRRLCGFDNETEWQQALRIAKQKLTLHARRLGAPTLFPRAKTGSEGQRFHPIEPKVYTWLREWIAGADSPGSGARQFPNPEDWGRDASGKPDEREVDNG